MGKYGGYQGSSAAWFPTYRAMLWPVCPLAVRITVPVTSVAFQLATLEIQTSQET